MDKLELLARNKFAPLSVAEVRVVQAASEGKVANCRNLGGGHRPAKTDAWAPARDVRADLIRWLCVDREAREQVDPCGVQIWGARIAGRLDLSSTNVLFPLRLLGCRLEQPLNLQNAKLPLLNLGGSWTQKIRADGLNLKGDLFLTQGFRAKGEVQLPGAIIGGDLVATGGTFKNPTGDALSADRAKIGGGVFLRQGFSAEGEVRLISATIGANLDADGGTFKNPNRNALSADGIKVTGSVFLTNGFHAEGEVRLPGAEINGRLVVKDARLEKLNLDSAHIAGPFVWRNVHQYSDPWLPEIKEWNPSLDLTNAKVESLVDLAASWPKKGGLILDGFVYDRITEGPTDAKMRLDWLNRQPDEDGYLPQPYEQLISVLRRMGHEDQVADVAIAKQKDLYEHGSPGRWGKVWSWFLFLVIGYGYKPWWAFGWMVALVIAGTLAFSVARSPSVGLMVASDKEAYQNETTEKAKLPHYYPEFHPLVYSIDVILPFDLGQKSHWRLIKNQSNTFVYWIFESYSLFQLFAGWVLLLVAGAVPAGFIKKD